MEPNKQRTEKNQTFKSWIASMPKRRLKHNFNNMYLTLKRDGKEGEFKRCVQQLTQRCCVPIRPLTPQQLQHYLRRSSVASSVTSESDLENNWDVLDECGGDNHPEPSGREASTADGYRSDGSSFESAEKGLVEALKLSEPEVPPENCTRCHRLNSCSTSSEDVNFFFVEKEVPSLEEGEAVLDHKEATQLVSSNDVVIPQKLNFKNVQEVDNFQTSDDIKMEPTGEEDSDFNSAITKPNVDSTSDYLLEKNISVDSPSVPSEFESQKCKAITSSNVLDAEEEGVEKNNQSSSAILPSMTSTSNETFLLNDVNIINTKKYLLQSQQTEETTVSQIPILILNNDNDQSLVPSKDNSEYNKHSETSHKKANSKHELNVDELASASRLTTESINVHSQKDATSTKCLQMNLLKVEKSAIATPKSQNHQLSKRVSLKQTVLNNYDKTTMKSKCKKSTNSNISKGNIGVQSINSWWNKYKNISSNDKISAYYHYPLDNFGSEESFPCSISSETSVNDSHTNLFDSIVKQSLKLLVGVKYAKTQVYPSAKIEPDYEPNEESSDLQYSDIPTLKFLTKHKLFHLLLSVLQESFQLQNINPSSKLPKMSENRLLSKFLCRLYSSHHFPTEMEITLPPIKHDLPEILSTSGVINLNDIKPNPPLIPVLLPPPLLDSSPPPSLQPLDSPKDAKFSCLPCVLHLPPPWPNLPPSFSPLMLSVPPPMLSSLPPPPTNKIMQVQAPPLPPLLPTPPLPPLPKSPPPIPPLIVSAQLPCSLPSLPHTIMPAPAPPLPPSLSTIPLPPLPNSPPPQLPKQTLTFSPFLSRSQSPPLPNTPPVLLSKSSPYAFTSLSKSLPESVNLSSSTIYTPCPFPVIKICEQPKCRLTMPPHQPVLSTLPDKTESQEPKSSLSSRQPPLPTAKESSVPKCLPQLCSTNREQQSHLNKIYDKSNVCNKTATQFPDKLVQHANKKVSANWHLTKCFTSPCIYIRNSISNKTSLEERSKTRNSVPSNTTSNTSQSKSYLDVSNEVRDPRIYMATWREPEQSSCFRITPAIHHTEEQLSSGITLKENQEKNCFIRKQVSPLLKVGKCDSNKLKCNKIKELPKETGLLEDKIENEENCVFSKEGEEHRGNKCGSLANKADNAPYKILLTNQVSMNSANEHKEDKMKRKSIPCQINLNTQYSNNFTNGNTDNNSPVHHIAETVIETALVGTHDIHEASNFISEGAKIEPPLPLLNKDVRDDHLLNGTTKEDNKEYQLNSTENIKPKNVCDIKLNQEVNSDLPSSNPSTTVALSAGINLGNCDKSKEHINHPVDNQSVQPEVNDKISSNHEVDSTIIREYVDETIPGEPVVCKYTKYEENIIISFEPLLKQLEENATNMCESTIECHVNRKHGDVGTREKETKVRRDSSLILKDLHVSSTEDKSDDKKGHSDEGMNKSHPDKNKPVTSGLHVMKRAGKMKNNQTLLNKVRSKAETKPKKSSQNTSLDKGSGSESRPNKQKHQSHLLVTLVEDQKKEISPSKSEQNRVKNVQEKQSCNTAKNESNCISDEPNTCEYDKLGGSKAITPKKSLPFKKLEKPNKLKKKAECANLKKCHSSTKSKKEYVPSALKLKFKNDVTNVIAINKIASKCANNSSSNTNSQVSNSPLKYKAPPTDELPKQNIRTEQSQILNPSISVSSKNQSQSKSPITNDVKSCSIPSIQSTRTQEVTTINFSVGSKKVHENLTNEHLYQSRTHVNKDWDTDLRTNLQNNISTKNERSNKLVKKRKIKKQEEPKKTKKLKTQKNDTVVSKSKLIKKKDKRKKKTHKKSSLESKVEELCGKRHSCIGMSHSLQNLLPSMPVISTDNDGSKDSSDVLPEFSNLHHSQKNTTICKSKSLNKQKILVSIPKSAINEDIWKNQLFLMNKSKNKTITDKKINDLIPSKYESKECANKILQQEELSFGKSTSNDENETETSKGVKRSSSFDENGGKKTCQVRNEPSANRKSVVIIEDEGEINTSVIVDTLKRKWAAIQSRSVSEKQCTNLSKRQRSSSETITRQDVVNLQENSKLVEMSQSDIVIEVTNSPWNSSIDSVKPLNSKPSDSTSTITVLNDINQLKMKFPQIDISPVKNQNNNTLQNIEPEHILTVQPAPSPMLIQDLNKSQRLHKSLSLDEKHNQTSCPQRRLSESVTISNLISAEHFNLHVDARDTNTSSNAILKESLPKTQRLHKELNLSRQSEEMVESTPSAQLDSCTRNLNSFSNSFVQSTTVTNVLQDSSNRPNENNVNSTGNISDNSKNTTVKEATIRVKHPSLLTSRSSQCLTYEDNSRNLQTITKHTWYRTPEQFDSSLYSESQNESSTSTNTAGENLCKNDLVTQFNNFDASASLKAFVNSDHRRLQFQKLIETGMLDGKNEFEKLCDIIECIKLDCVLRDNYIAQVKKLPTQESQEEEVERTRKEFEKNSLVRKTKFCNTFTEFIKFFNCGDNMKYPLLITIYFYLSRKIIAISEENSGLKEYLLNILKKWVYGHESEDAFEKINPFFKTDYDIICKMFDNSISLIPTNLQILETSSKPSATTVNTVAAAENNLTDFNIGSNNEPLEIDSEREQSGISGESSEYAARQLNSLESLNSKNASEEVIELCIQTTRPLEQLQTNSQIPNTLCNYPEPSMPNMERTPQNVFSRQTSLQSFYARNDDHEHNRDKTTVCRAASLDSGQITLSAPDNPVITYNIQDNPHYLQPMNVQQYSRPSVLSFGTVYENSDNHFSNKSPNVSYPVTGQTNLAEIRSSMNSCTTEPQVNIQPAVPQQIQHKHLVTNNLNYATQSNKTNNKPNQELRSSNIGPQLQHQFVHCNTNTNFVPQHQFVGSHSVVNTTPTNTAVYHNIPGQSLHQQTISQCQDDLNRPSQNLQETNRNQIVNQWNYSKPRQENHHALPVPKSRKKIQRQTLYKTTTGYTQGLIPMESTSNFPITSSPLQQMASFTNDFQPRNPLQKPSHVASARKNLCQQSTRPRMAQQPSSKLKAKKSLRTVNQYERNVYQPSSLQIHAGNMQMENQSIVSQRRNSQLELNSSFQPCSSNVSAYPNSDEPLRNFTQISNQNHGQTQQIPTIHQTFTFPRKPVRTSHIEEFYKQQTQPNTKSGEAYDHIDLTDENVSLSNADIEKLCSILSENLDFVSSLSRSEFENGSEHISKDSGSDQLDRTPNEMYGHWGDPTIYQRGNYLDHSGVGINIDEHPIPLTRQQESSLQNVPSVALITDQTTNKSAQFLQEPINTTSVSSALLEIGHMREVLSKSQMLYHNFGGKQLTSNQAIEFLDLLESIIKHCDVMDGLETYFVGSYIMRCGRVFAQCELQELAKYFVILIRKRLEKKTGTRPEGECLSGNSINTELDKRVYIDVIKRHIVKSLENGFDLYGHLLNLSGSGDKNKVAQEIRKACNEMIAQKRRKT